MQVSSPLKTTNGALIYYKYDKMIVVYIITIAAIQTNYNTNMFLTVRLHDKSHPVYWYSRNRSSQCFQAPPYMPIINFQTYLDTKNTTKSNLSGTSEDYVQIIIAVFGGFLQQMIGPRRFNQSINNLFFAVQFKYSCMFQ